MGGLFSMESPLWSFLGKMADVFWLSILWIICCIPVVTIGASTSAMYYVCLKMARGEEGYVTKQFFHALKDNFLQGLVLEILTILTLGMVVINLMFYSRSTSLAITTLGAFSFFVGVILLMTLQCAYAVIAQFQNSVRSILKFSFLLVVSKIGWGILTMLVPVGVILLSLQFFPPLLVVSPGIIMAINGWIFNRMFKPYLEKKEEEAEL